MALLNGNYSWLPSAAISALAGVSSAVVMKYALSGKSGNAEQTPTKWLKVGEVKELVIYPVKSCKGTEVSSATVTQLGLKAGELLRDRIFMIINESGTYQVQMKHPKMTLIAIDFPDDEHVRISAPGMPTIIIDLPKPSANNRRSCRIFQETGLKALDCGDEAAQWFQKFVGEPSLRLVYHDGTKTQRNLSDFQKKFTTTSPIDLAAFQNYTSFLVIANESIDELNKHLTDKVDSRNFRPSILVSDVAEPFSEIRWGVVRIGEDVLLRASKPCERCKITTVNPDTGEYHAEGEPLKTLTKLIPDFGNDTTKNLLKNRGIMGVQMGLLDRSYEGKTIKVGDPVYVALL